MHGYPHPETYIVRNGSLCGLDIEEIRYPVLIKPNHTFGARGMTLCRNKDELEKKYPIIFNQLENAICRHIYQKEGIKSKSRFILMKNRSWFKVPL